MPKSAPPAATASRLSPTLLWHRLSWRYTQTGAVVWLAIALMLTASVAFAITAEKPWGRTVQKRIEKHQALQPKEYAVIGLWWGSVASAGVLGLLLGTAGLWMPKAVGQSKDSAPSACPPALKRWLWLGLLGVVAFGAWERYPRLSHSLWNDEEYAMRKFAHGAWLQKGDSGLIFEPASWTETLFENRNGNNHILNSIVTRMALVLWREAKHANIDAFDETALRTPAFIAGLCTIGMIFLLGCEMNAPWTGLAAAFILAAHPWHVRYAVEAKGYSLMLFGICVSLYSIHRALKTDKFAWWLLFAFSEAVYLLSFAGSLYVAIAVNALAALELMKRRESRRVLTLAGFNFLAAVPVILLMAPSIPQLLAYLKSDDALHLGMGEDWRKDLFAHLLIGFQYNNPLPDQHCGASLSTWFASCGTSHAFLGWVIPGLFCLGLVCAMVKNSATRLFIVAPTVAALLSYAHNAAQHTPMVVWYLVYGLIPLALAIPLGIEMILRKPRWLAPPAIAGVATAFALTTADARHRMRDFDRQPIKETIAFIQTSSPHAITADFGVSDRQSASYDPSVVVLGKLPDLVTVIGRAVHEHRPLDVYYCGERESGRRQPELLHALQGGCDTPLASGWKAHFELMKSFPGHEEMFSYKVYRLANAAEVETP